MKLILSRLRSGSEQIYLSNCEQVVSGWSIEVATKLELTHIGITGAIRRPPHI